MSQLEQNIMNINEAIGLLDDLDLDDCGSPECSERQMRRLQLRALIKLEDIKEALLGR